MGVDLKAGYHPELYVRPVPPVPVILLQKGDASGIRDLFIDWNKFWEGCGNIDEEGVLVPRQEYIKDMFFRKPGLPVLVVELPTAPSAPTGTTFYQQVDVDGTAEALPGPDNEHQLPLVKGVHQQTLKTLAGYGAKIVR